MKRLPPPSHSSSLDYLFTGKLTIFPLFVFSSLVSFGLLYAFVDTAQLDEGLIIGKEFYYGVAGVGLFVISSVFLIALLRWLVFRVTFRFDGQTNILTIKKIGFLLSSTLQFDLNQTSFFYLRTHFIPSKTWLTLVVKEGSTYYRVLSWKGQGKQRKRFFEFFTNLLIEREKWQHHAATPAAGGAAAGPDISAINSNYIESLEMVTKEEVNFLNPFSSKIHAIINVTKSLSEDDEDDGYDSARMASNKMIVEELPCIVFDSFFSHFEENKIIATE